MITNDFNLFSSKYRNMSQAVKRTCRSALEILGITMKSYYQNLQHKELPDLTLKQIAVLKKAFRVSDEQLLEELKKIPGNEYKFLAKLQLNDGVEQEAEKAIQELEKKFAIQKVV